MHVLLVVIGLIWIVVGFALFSHPGSTRSYLTRAFPADRVGRMVALPLGVGALLLFGAVAEDSLRLLYLLLGAAAVGKGLFLLTTPRDKLERILDRILYEAHEKTVKRWGIALFLAGLALVALLS